MTLNARLWLAHLRRRGLVGAALLLCAALAYATLAVPGTVRRDSLADRARPGLPTSKIAGNDHGDAETGLEAFWHALPSTASVPQWLGRIRGAAVLSGLALHSVDYKLERAPDAPLLRYRITLPVTGSYGQVRTFIGTVLSDVPALAVDDVQFKRGEGSSRQLDARIRLTLFIAAGDPR